MENKIFSLLTAGGTLPDFIALTPVNNEPETIGSIRKIVLRTGTKKAEFFQHRLARFKNKNNGEIESEVVPPVWNEEEHKNSYMIPGMKAALKVGVRKNTQEQSFLPGEIHLSGDVETIHGNQVLSRPKTLQTMESIFHNLVNLLSVEEGIFTVRSSLAGLVKDTTRGAVITESHRLRVDHLTHEEIGQYISSLTRSQLERAPAGILWPHPLILSRIQEIDGLSRGDERFQKKMISLFNALLNIPDQTDVLIRHLDQLINMVPLTEESNLYRFIVPVSEKPPFQMDEVFDSKWSEISVLPNGELMELMSASSRDYEAISNITEINFRRAPNYSYLQTPDKEDELQKFITANSPESIKHLCETTPQLCNLVARINDEVVGFRVVRKKLDEERGLIADGRRMHVALGQDGKGIGSVLLRRSEQMARQQGCKIMEIHATGDSHRWFLNQGYRVRRQVENSQGVFKDKPSVFLLMMKDLDQVI